MKILSAFALAIALVAFSCGESNSSTEEDGAEEVMHSIGTPEPSSAESSVPAVTPSGNLLDGKWEVNAMPGAPLDELFPNGMPNVIFVTDKNSVGGYAGCNSFRGSFSTEGNAISWTTELATTRKMCPDMTGEDTFLKTLRGINQFSISERGQTLNLISGDIASIRLKRVAE